jgi:hypothetical protein
MKEHDSSQSTGVRQLPQLYLPVKPYLALKGHIMITMSKSSYVDSALSSEAENLKSSPVLYKPHPMVLDHASAS